MIIKTDADIIKGYFEDYSGLLGGYADKVILPENEKDVREILLEASAKNIPVTISGGGTGVTGARIPTGKRSAARAVPWARCCENLKI